MEYRIPIIKKKSLIFGFNFRDCETKRCDYPTAFLDFSNPSFQFQFERGEHYKFVIDLLVPETPTNHDVGEYFVLL